MTGEPSCADDGRTPYRRAGPPAAVRQPWPVAEASMFALSLAACLALTVGMLG